MIYVLECLTGYESVQGNPCKKCSNGYYGRKCSNVCMCANDRLAYLYLNRIMSNQRDNKTKERRTQSWSKEQTQTRYDIEY